MQPSLSILVRYSAVDKNGELGQFRDNISYFSVKACVARPHKNNLTEMVLIRGHNICIC